MTFQGTETYLIECSRENSVINTSKEEATNGAWPNETEFNIKAGDRISVEMVCANIRGSGTGAPTIELSGTDVVRNGINKAYCDNKVLLEVFYYMNNNNTYSVGLPLIHPAKGINGPGEFGGFNNMTMPINLNPRVPQGNVTNQIINYREPNNLNAPGYIYEQMGGAALCGKAFTGINLLPLTSSIPLPQQLYTIEGYQIYQYQDSTGAWLVPGTAPALLPQLNNYLTGIRLTPYAAYQEPQTTPADFGVNGLPYLTTDFTNGCLKGRTGRHLQNNFYVGNHVWTTNYTKGLAETSVNTCWLGEIAEISGRLGLGDPVFNIPVLEIEDALIEQILFKGVKSEKMERAEASVLKRYPELFKEGK